MTGNFIIMESRSIAVLLSVSHRGKGVIVRSEKGGRGGWRVERGEGGREGGGGREAGGERSGE